MRMKSDLRPSPERRVPQSVLHAALLAAALLSGSAGAQEDGVGTAADDGRIARLIGQLGDDAFTKREAAEKELLALGGPALPALQAAADSDDPEIQMRAERLAGAIHRAIPRLALARLEGTWIRQTAEANGRAAPKDDPPVRYIFKDGVVVAQAGDKVVQQATWTVVEASGAALLVDYAITAGVNEGRVVRGMYTLDGDELRWCYSFAPAPRPEAFATRPGDNNSMVTLKRE